MCEFGSFLFIEFNKIDIRLGTIIKAKECLELKNPSISLELDFGDFVVFTNLLPHRSGSIRNANAVRLSLQLRFDDLCDPHYLSMGWPSNATQPDIQPTKGSPLPQI